MKNIKEMIISILLGFTFLTSIYSTIKLVQVEDEIQWLLFNKLGDDKLKMIYKSETVSRSNSESITLLINDYERTQNDYERTKRKVTDLEDELEKLKRKLRGGLNIY